ncbi:hypothetical protein [Paenibacillus qinlingensis]|nr:hypothetical protein [Paenibacillus qinlingensis]
MRVDQSIDTDTEGAIDMAETRGKVDAIDAVDTRAKWTQSMQ